MTSQAADMLVRCFDRKGEKVKDSVSSLSPEFGGFFDRCLKRGGRIEMSSLNQCLYSTGLWQQTLIVGSSEGVARHGKPDRILDARTPDPENDPNILGLRTTTQNGPPLTS